MKGRTPLYEDELRRYLDERCQDFRDTHGIEPDGVLAHPAEPFIMQAARDRGLRLMWDAFCPRGQLFPLHVESFEEMNGQRLERQMAEASAALKMWKARQR